MAKRLGLRIHDGLFAVGRLPPGAPLPGWADGPGFVSLTRTRDELSVICPAERMPPEIQAVTGWRLLELVGPFEFDETGVMAAIAGPLGEAGISLLPVATHDTDYLLVKKDMLDPAVAVLEDAGHRVTGR